MRKAPCGHTWGGGFEVEVDVYKRQVLRPRRKSQRNRPPETARCRPGGLP